MRLRNHLISSALVGLAGYPRSPKKALLVILAGVLIDFDHFAVYALHTGDWTVAGALHYDRYRHYRAGNGDTRPRYGSLRSWIHRPELILPPLWWLARNVPLLRPIAIGLTLHLVLDHRHWPEEAFVLIRARGHCERCQQAAPLKTRLVGPERNGRRPRMALCGSCIEQLYDGVV
jgi:hypothetical protein